MAGINDLSNELRNALAEDSQAQGILRGVAGDIDEIIRDCWHDPAERLPIVNDGLFQDGGVISISHVGRVYRMSWRRITTQNTWRWARINDVLLMPPMGNDDDR